MKPESRYALIVAGGSGSRMQASIPKQFMLLNGRPLLMQTLERFAEYEIVLVLPELQIDRWKELCHEYEFTMKHTIVAGGETRTESVFHGLQHIPENALVAIHDGVRPLVSAEMIHRGFRLAESEGSAIPVVEMTDSIRQLTEDGSRCVDRTKLRSVQTPQIFVCRDIREAYLKCKNGVFTDDASVFEAVGHKLSFYEGEFSNIKITRPLDLSIAEAILNTQKK